MAPDKVTLTVLITTYNAERFIRGCLESVKGWVDEIIIIDMFSQDKTIEIAKEYTERIIQFQEQSHETRTNIGIDMAKSGWILKLLATERITPELRNEIIATINDPQKRDICAYHIPRKSYCTCEFIQETPGPVYLFRKGCARFDSSRLHAQAQIKGKIGRLKNSKIHWASFSFEQGIEKLNRYTSVEAKMAFAGRPDAFWWKKPVYKVTPLNIIYRMCAGFYMFYFQAKFYRYGIHGFLESIGGAFYFYAEMAKLWELQYKQHNTKDILLTEGLIQEEGIFEGEKRA